MAAKKDLSPAEVQRLARLSQIVEKMSKNKRGRRKPSVMPSHMARTSAFAPRRNGLITDSNLERTYVVEGHSVVYVKGRELGTQHRDVIYAIFRLPRRKLEVINPKLLPPGITQRPTEPRFGERRWLGPVADKPTITHFEVKTTWREILRAMGLSEHVNNMLNTLRIMEEVKQVTFRVFRGDYGKYLAATQRGEIAGPGFSANLLGDIEWDGVNLDSTVTIPYGDWVREMFEKNNLVSVNADVYFQLSSDYAKSIWPFIDSQPSYSWIEESFIAELIGRNLSAEDSKKRGKFREQVRAAFADMKLAGGLAAWAQETIGSGRAKTYRWTYKHALPRQCELPGVDLAGVTIDGAVAPPKVQPPMLRQKRRRGSGVRKKTIERQDALAGLFSKGAVGD